MRTQKSCIRTKEFLVAYIPDTKDVGVLRSPYKTRYYNDINYYLTGKLRGRFKSALKARGVYKTSTALSLLGCSLDFFRVYIESKFTEGMTWENKGKFGWHIDHIKPLCSFNLLDIEQQKLAFHYTNLQPLWWRENLTKGRKSYAD